MNHEVNNIFISMPIISVYNFSFPYIVAITCSLMDLKFELHVLARASRFTNILSSFV